MGGDDELGRSESGSWSLIATAGLVLGYLHFAIIVLLMCAVAGFLVVGIAASQNQ